MQDSLWKKSSILLYYIGLRTRLNNFEMFLSSLIPEKTLKTVLFYKKTVLRGNHVKIGNNIIGS